MSSLEHSQQSGRSRDEQEKFPWARTEFPSPGSWARGALVQSLVSSSWILVFSGRKIAADCSHSIANVHSWRSAEASAHP